MKIAFIALGMILIVLFLVWILFVKSEQSGKWTVLALDIALVVASTAVLGAGFWLRGGHIAASAVAEAEQEPAGGGSKVKVPPAANNPAAEGSKSPASTEAPAAAGNKSPAPPSTNNPANNPAAEGSKSPASTEAPAAAGSKSPAPPSTREPVAAESAKPKR